MIVLLYFLFLEFIQTFRAGDTKIALTNVLGISLLCVITGKVKIMQCILSFILIFSFLHFAIDAFRIGRRKGITYVFLFIKTLAIYYAKMPFTVWYELKKYGVPKVIEQFRLSESKKIEDAGFVSIPAAVTISMSVAVVSFYVFW
ncbi:hypothetical protein ABEV55_14775 [Aneurinibacillus thermoaerophilus]|uniref:hypothetical protein n=1 Tax=Aneurinibacillus thermoaerophilus TaxID=143495 RepID=UPI002E1B11F7|nr:hypothetical protein [Aneurinibacillus thermoaerophilus]